MLESYSTWLKAQPKARLDQSQLIAGYVEAFPEFRSVGNLRIKVREALDLLESSGVLRLPANKAGWDAYGAPRLPLWAMVVREKAERADFSAVNWLPELSFATQVLRGSQLDKLRVINQYLIQNRGKFTVMLPYRERALEIFGDEKAFEGAVKGEMLYGRIPLSLIGACNPEPPLAREDFKDASGPLLVLENHHTYWSMLQWNRQALLYRSIGYGSGNTIIKSAPAIGDALQRSGASEAAYLGDLDPTGIQIGATLNRELIALGLPALRPAADFYGWMLENGVKRDLEAGKRVEVSNALDWLPDTLRQAVTELFGSGKWIPQESLSLSALLQGSWTTSL